MDIIVWVPAREREHFWHDVPDAVEEWWTLGKVPAKFKEGDHIWFQIDDHLVARAKVYELRSEDQQCDVTARNWSGIHVVWKIEDFERLVEPQAWPKRVTRGFCYKEES